jgi:hypothetical protein
VVVGDVLGPLLFILYMDGYLRDLQATRRAARWPLELACSFSDWQAQGHQDTAGALMQRLTKAGYFCDLSDVTYADDHDCFRPVLHWRAVRQELELLRATQKRWKLTANTGKSSVMVLWRGKGAKRARAMRVRHLELSDGERIPISATQTHLGHQRRINGSHDHTVTLRCKKARALRAVFQKRILGTK